MPSFKSQHALNSALLEAKKGALNQADCSQSYASLLVGLLHGRSLTIGFMGDTRAIMVDRLGTGRLVSGQHLPTIAEEMLRITQKGG